MTLLQKALSGFYVSLKIEKFEELKLDGTGLSPLVFSLPQEILPVSDQILSRISMKIKLSKYPVLHLNAERNTSYVI